jgi:hypothetical protein
MFTVYPQELLIGIVDVISRRKQMNTLIELLGYTWDLTRQNGGLYQQKKGNDAMNIDADKIVISVET